MRSLSEQHRVIFPRFSYNTIAFHGPHRSCYKGVLLYIVPYSLSQWYRCWWPGSLISGVVIVVLNVLGSALWPFSMFFTHYSMYLQTQNSNQFTVSHNKAILSSSKIPTVCPVCLHLYIGIGAVPNTFIMDCFTWNFPPLVLTQEYARADSRCAPSQWETVWDDIFTPTISSPRGENIVLIFSPPLRYFHPLTISNGKSCCSQISLNFIMCIYNKEPFLYFLWLFKDFCSSQTVDTTLTKYYQEWKYNVTIYSPPH